MNLTDSITAIFRMPLSLAKKSLVAFLLLASCNLSEPGLAQAQTQSQAQAQANLDRELFETAAQIQAMADGANLQENLMPLLSKLSGALESSSNRDFRAHFLLSLIYARLGMEDLSKSELDLAQKNGAEEFKQLALHGLDYCVLNSDFVGAAVFFTFCVEAYTEAATVAV